MKKASILLSVIIAFTFLFSCGSENETSDDMDIMNPITSLTAENTLTFLDTEVEQTSQISLRIDNDGNQDIAVVQLSNAISEFVITPSSFALEAGASKTITIDFTPTAAADYSDKITAKSDAETLLEITVTGKGTEPVTSAKVTFTKDIKPLIESKCQGCHSAYTVYNSTKDDINKIINRINRPATGDSQLMPRSGPKLPQAELDKFQQWLTDGLLEN